MCRNEKIELFLFVADDLSTCVKALTQRVGADNRVLLTVNREAQLILLRFLDFRGAQHAPLQVFLTKIAFFDEIPYLVRIVVPSRGDKRFNDPQPSAARSFPSLVQVSIDSSSERPTRSM